MKIRFRFLLTIIINSGNSKEPFMLQHSNTNIRTLTAQLRLSLYSSLRQGANRFIFWSDVFFSVEMNLRKAKACTIVVRLIEVVLC